VADAAAFGVLCWPPLAAPGGKRSSYLRRKRSAHMAKIILEETCRACPNCLGSGGSRRGLQLEHLGLLLLDHEIVDVGKANKFIYLHGGVRGALPLLHASGSAG